MVLWAVMVCVVWWILLLQGCTTTKVVTVPEYHTEYIVRTDTFARLDSVYIHDSIYTYHTGDTVLITKVRYKDRIRNVCQVRTDTIIRADSVRVPCPVERGLTKTERRYITLGKYATGVLLAIVVAVIACAVWRMVRKRKA